MICAKFNCASNNVKCVLYFFIKDLSYSWFYSILPIFYFTLIHRIFL
jgi:hypothetical protein